MGAELVEPELGRRRECGLGETSPFVLLACDLSDPSREGQDPRRRGRDRVAGESLRAREMLADEIVLTPLPEDAREERLRLGRALGVADRQQRVSGGFERILLPRLVVGPVKRDGTAETGARAARRRRATERARPRIAPRRRRSC